MTKVIRPLSKSDYRLYKFMQTGLEEDYMLDIFPALTDGESRLFGLFIDEQLVSTAGYTIFANHFVMLGRLRSDTRFRGKSYGTEILEYVKNRALDIPDIEFVGANTEAYNTPAQKVLQKIKLPLLTTLYAAQTQDLSSLSTDRIESWVKVEDLGRKKEWISRTYLNDDFPETIFPFGAYYPFPASDSLFKEDFLKTLNFYENESQSRYLILDEEDKGGNYLYLHVIYPWDDFMEQTGFWETIHEQLSNIKNEKPHVVMWMDLTEEKAQKLPESHPLTLPSPWMLHGIYTNPEKSNYIDLNTELTEAHASLEQLESELAEIENELNQKIEQTEELRQSLDKLDS